MNDDKERRDRKLMHKREEEKVRHRFSALSEIKQELSHYIAVGGANGHTSKLKEILLQLEKFPDSQEKDVEKLRVLSDILERIKAIARLEILTIRIRLDAGLDDVRAGTHTRKDVSGSISSEFRVDRILTIDILPSFYVPAKLMIVYQPTVSRIIFGVCLSVDNVSSSVAQIEVSGSWNDPLEAILCKLNLFHSRANLSGDGIWYDLHYLAIGSKAHIQFYNPTYSQFIDLERAFFSVAETVVTQKSQGPEHDYLAKWRKYLAKQKNA